MSKVLIIFEENGYLVMTTLRGNTYAASQNSEQNLGIFFSKMNNGIKN